MLFGLGTGNSFAQSCQNGTKLAKKIFAKKEHAMPSNVFAVYLDIYNEIVAKNGSARIGSRYLGIDKAKERGTVMGQTTRTFVTHPSVEGTVEVLVEKTGGKAKTGIMVCAYSKNGSNRSLPVYEFPNGKGLSTKRFQVRNAKDKIIIVAVKNKSVGNKFQYRVSAK
jgi:hypothetical protein